MKTVLVYKSTFDRFVAYLFFPGLITIYYIIIFHECMKFHHYFIEKNEVAYLFIRLFIFLN